MKLSAVQDLERKIEITRSQLETLRTVATNITSKLGGLPRAKAQTSKVEAVAVRIVDVENQLAELCDELADKSFLLADEIYRRVKGVACTVLFERYVMCKTFAQIATDMNYSEASIYYFHRRGKKEYERTDLNDKNHDNRRRNTGGTS